MASGILHRAMVYLGLVDDDYEEYDAYEETQTVGRPGPRSYLPEASDGGGAVAIRTLPRESPPEPQGGGTLITSRPVTGGASVRPIPSPVQSAKVHVVAPAKFADAQEIGDRFKNGQPVIVNLQSADRELGRRMIDFCSGVTYALGASMDKVADQVFLLTPSNVEVSAEEKRRLQERGLYRS
ncbi:MAG: cell division inhibitor SepF [Acidimicrobiaceae bacterium]|nr:cell division inhibitor SepF [Acidimicrobiaceae bacterium]MDQ1442106.1 cell division inhibitor SepF [Acidimicrobiaceae bacterium]